MIGYYCKTKIYLEDKNRGICISLILNLNTGTDKKKVRGKGGGGNKGQIKSKGKYIIVKRLVSKTTLT